MKHTNSILQTFEYFCHSMRRVDYNLACFVFSSLSGQAPPYFADDIHSVSGGPRRRLRSSTDRSCAVPRTHTQHIRRVSLSPGHVFGTVFRPTCATSTYNSFRRELKTFCFNVASGAQWDLC